ncbi:MAG: hypothetical protein ACLPTQ_07945 [Terriglobales bacterium]
MGLQYLHCWLQGSGRVPIYNLTEEFLTLASYDLLD